jgi:pimeloyl-ACP methyl ester carboxylesterase
LPPLPRAGEGWGEGASKFVTINWAARDVRIEHQWIAPTLRQAQGERSSEVPLVIFLHEGLGSLSMWRDFPQRLCDAAQVRGFVYSRPGYGRSTPRAAEEAWDLDFMHRQAHEVLPALLQALDVTDKPWLFGHSDGGSIALLYAAKFSAQIEGAIVLAPHILVEELSVASIAEARTAYQHTDLRQRLAKHHDDPDSAFWGWNNVWLDPAFRHWSIEREIETIICPLLAMQGIDDQYGTLEQIRGIARRLPKTRLLELANCGHSPHRDQPDRVIAASVAFMQQTWT